MLHQDMPNHIYCTAQLGLENPNVVGEKYTTQFDFLPLHAIDYDQSPE